MGRGQNGPKRVNVLFEWPLNESQQLRPNQTYAKLKTETGFEEYIEFTENIMDRTAITKIRSITN